MPWKDHRKSIGMSKSLAIDIYLTGIRVLSCCGIGDGGT